MIIAVALAAVVLVAALLSFGRFARSVGWRATVTPLASIIGSGYLICGPLLAKEFGIGAIEAMALLLLLAYAVGAVIRFNIIHVENLAPTLSWNDPIAWFMRVAQAVLAIAYAVSVAYYLKLLAEFGMKPFAVPEASHGLIANMIVTAIIGAFSALALSGDLKKVEHAAHGTVSIKLGIIAGMLVALAWWWIMHPGGSGEPLPPLRMSWASIPMLLGLLITVQGFETSRYMGASYDQATRIRSMRYAQIISSIIYIAFLALLTPVLAPASRTEGVAGILDIMEMVAPLLGIFVLAGATASQLSAALADSIGAGGLMVEVSRRTLTVRGAFILAGVLSILVVWLTDPFQVIALSSRAFALFYAMQAALALWVAIRTGVGSFAIRIGFSAIALICLIAVVAGAPAEG